MCEKPLVSIGLPIYNEERFLKETLESLLAQDYSNIEIIISDNASDDDTGNICSRFSAKYPNKVKYIKQNSNIGLGANFRTVLDSATGKYFMWACGHDLWSSNYVSASVEILNNYSDVQVVVPTSHWIDAKGEYLDKKSGYSDTRGMDEIARYFTIFWGNMHPAYGMLRIDSLRKWKVRELVGEDLVLLTFLALRGNFYHLSNIHWYRREFRFEKSYKQRLKRYKKGVQKVAKGTTDKVIPFARLVYYLIYEVVNSNATFMNKTSILLLLIPSIFIRFVSGKNQYKAD